MFISKKMEQSVQYTLFTMNKKTLLWSVQAARAFPTVVSGRGQRGVWSAVRLTDGQLHDEA